MSSALSPGVAASLREKIDKRTEGPSPEIPGLIYTAIDRQGNVIFSHASGSVGLNVGDPMTLDTTFWLASCTKLITSIACMQLVEQGRLRLDDAEQVEQLAPELKDVKVIEPNGHNRFRLVRKQRGITLRMLLTHTAGFGYAFDDFRLTSWARPIGLDDFSGDKDDILTRPLVNQPGTGFQYGTSIDWVGVLIERVTTQLLEEYFQEHIFKPLDIRNISFFPAKDIKSRLAYLHQRSPDGALEIIDHLYRTPLVTKSGDNKAKFCMAGAGCFGSPVEYTRLIAVILNNGTYDKTNAQLLKPETVQEMFTDQIPDKPRYCGEYSPTAKPLLANSCPIFPVPDELTEGWGLSFSLSHTTSSTGRAAGSGSWEGLANLFWFADRENGLGGIIASQILPYGDAKVLECSDETEAAIYKDLVRSD